MVSLGLEFAGLPGRPPLSSSGFVRGPFSPTTFFTRSPTFFPSSNHQNGLYICESVSVLPVHLFFFRFKCYVIFDILLLIFFKDFIYLFLDREGREKERERSINVWLPPTHPLLGTWPAIQACALTGNWTGDPLVRKLVLNPLSHTSQGYCSYFLNHFFFLKKTL